MRLRKAKYGLWLASHDKYHTLSNFLIYHGFRRTLTYPYVFVHGDGGDILMISVHVDNTNIVCANLTEV